MEIGRTHSSSEEEAHRPTKQLKISNAPSRGPEMGEVQQSEPRAWLPAPMLGVQAVEALPSLVLG